MFHRAAVAGAMQRQLLNSKAALLLPLPLPLPLPLLLLQHTSQAMPLTIVPMHMWPGFVVPAGARLVYIGPGTRVVDGAWGASSRDAPLVPLPTDAPAAVLVLQDMPDCIDLVQDCRELGLQPDAANIEVVPLVNAAGRRGVDGYACFARAAKEMDPFDHMTIDWEALAPPK